MKTSLADIAIRKLSSGQELTDAERKAIGMSPASKGVTGPTGPVGPTGTVGATGTPTGTPVATKLQSTYVDPETGDVIDVYDDGSEKIRKKGTVALDTANAEKLAAEEKRLAGKSAYDILFNEFKKYGLESLVTPLKGFIQDGYSDAEFTLKLRDTPEYQTRFAANKKRIANGFAAIDEATYLGLEDKFQTLSQNYGMPASYYAKNTLGTQSYFEEAIGNNVDPVTFEERIMEGKKVLDANKFTLDAIKKLYPTLNDGDFLGYVLNTKNGLSDIQRKVTSAEIGGAQLGAGLVATAAGAEALAKGGVTGQAYQKAASTIAEDTMRGGQLAAMYKQDPYTQQTAEADILNLPGSAAAKKQTKKLAQLETAAFSGRAGLGAIARDRAGVL